MKWQEEYKRKLVSAEEAARLIKSGDRVMAVGGSTDVPKVMPQALFARREELRDVEILSFPPITDPGWLQPGHEEHFKVNFFTYTGPIGRPALLERRASFTPVTWALTLKNFERRNEYKDIDWDIVTISSPNERGFCNLGYALWLKKDFIKSSKKVIAEVDSNKLWHYGDTTVHISEIDYLVEHAAPIISNEELHRLVADIEPEEKRKLIEETGRTVLPHLRPLLMTIFPLLDVHGIQSIRETIGLVPPPEAKAIAEYVNLLIKNRDTIQVGMGSPSIFLAQFGAFAGKEDLGLHSEMGARGVGKLIEEGVINGKYKTLHPDKAILSSLDGFGPEELVYASENPKIELYSSSYVTAIPVVAANDNLVAINNGISVDLTSQINAETIFGGIPLYGSGGQPECHIGALFSKGGRAITVMRSTALEGTISCIVPQFEPGAVVTVPRHYADYVVTEYSIARLMDKSTRERAEELIAIAHPDFRAELRKQAQKIFWP